MLDFYMLTIIRNIDLDVTKLESSITLDWKLRCTWEATV